jgi:hypothetical protein
MPEIRNSSVQNDGYSLRTVIEWWRSKPIDSTTELLSDTVEFIDVEPDPRLLAEETVQLNDIHD